MQYEALPFIRAGQLKMEYTFSERRVTKYHNGTTAAQVPGKMLSLEYANL